MDYKTILLHIDDTPGVDERTAFAAALARRLDAHLVGMTQTGIAPFIRDTAWPGVELGDLPPLFEGMRKDAEQRGARFGDAARRAGVVSFEHRIGDEDDAVCLAFQAMYADLVIVGASDPAAVHPGNHARIPQYVAMNSPSPVLVLPQAVPRAPTFERVLVAWNASPEAARALRLALPFVKRARQVEVVLFEEAHRSDGAERNAAEVALFLRRHGVAVNTRRQANPGDVGSALLDLAAKLGSELLVMGCYGHARYREALLGGASRTVLQRMPLATLMAH